MEFIKVLSKCKKDINVDLKCEFCGKMEMVYGYDTDEWYNSIKAIKCLKCGRCTSDNQSLDKIKSCPFCGGKAALYLLGDSFSICCCSCGGTIICQESENIAIKHWNSRV